jgi:hypothetical protein
LLAQVFLDQYRSAWRSSMLTTSPQRHAGHFLLTAMMRWFARIHGDPVEEFSFFWAIAMSAVKGPALAATSIHPLGQVAAHGTWSAALDQACPRITGIMTPTLSSYRWAWTRSKMDFPVQTRQPDYSGSAGALLHSVPTLFVMEGGYAVEAIGVNVNVLKASEGA